MQMVQRAMLPVLLKLLHLPTVLEEVPQALTHLLRASSPMQQAANDSDAVSSLTTLLQHEQTWHNRPRFKVLKKSLGSYSLLWSPACCPCSILYRNQPTLPESHPACSHTALLQHE